MNVKFNKIETELKKFKSDINDLKNNDRTLTEWCKVTNSRLVLFSNTCDRIESKFQVQNYELEYLSINKINYQHAILKNDVLEIFNNTNLFATHLERSDSERQTLRNAICAHLEKIYRNSEPNSHMPRHSTPLTEETIYVKEIKTPFLGENAISAKDISKLEEWETFPGEGTYNHIH
ncbi:hypothetical protein O181_064877 [Austropuccinia psidii MF-1]|uniref:Uncharacterized protein n=1 Tax=Austropuccinia psidii MF-1 TaxID=1389203 RepID=A0A9Q3I2T2_9BASI|nr:hypothetical protein [Austropuccinia psidii MF-1]